MSWILTCLPTNGLLQKACNFLHCFHCLIKAMSNFFCTLLSVQKQQLAHCFLKEINQQKMRIFCQCRISFPLCEHQVVNFCQGCSCSSTPGRCSRPTSRHTPCEPCCSLTRITCVLERECACVCLCLCLRNRAVARVKVCVCVCACGTYGRLGQIADLLV